MTARPNNSRDIRSDILVVMFVPSTTYSWTVADLQNLLGDPWVSTTAIRNHLNVMSDERFGREAWVKVVPAAGRARRWRLTPKGREVASFRKRDKNRREQDR